MPFSFPGIQAAVSTAFCVLEISTRNQNAECPELREECLRFKSERCFFVRKASRPKPARVYN